MQPADFVVPTETCLESLRAARRQYQKELLRELLRLARQPSPGAPDSTPPLYEVLRHAAEKDGAALLDCVSAPPVAVVATCVPKRGQWPVFRARLDEARREMAPRLLLELALKGLLPPGGACVEASCDLASPSLGAVLKPQAGARRWRFDNGFAGVDGAAPLRLSSPTLVGRRPTSGGVASELGYVPLVESITLALVDSNPIAQFEAHPDKAGNALDLGGRAEEDWRAALDQSLMWVHEFWPELFQEMCLLLRQIVPVGFFKDKHQSASYRELIGTVYMSLHPNPVTMTEALIHEFQHNKLNLFSYGDALLENAFHPLYKSPLRPDPRPLWGVLLGAHAFLPVAALLRRMRDAGHPVTRGPDFAKRLADIDAKNREGLSTLRAHARWTPAGEKIMEALERLETVHAA